MPSATPGGSSSHRGFAIKDCPDRERVHPDDQQGNDKEGENRHDGLRLGLLERSSTMDAPTVRILIHVPIANF